MRHIESEIQRICVSWFRLQWPKHTIMSIPNGGRRGKIEASILKGEGMLAGVADLFLMYPSRSHCGLWIEIKTPAGRQSESQKAFEKKAIENGYKYVIIRDLDSFIQTINEYLK